jgi:pyridoxal phosphate enzyme (YggS family)
MSEIKENLARIREKLPPTVTLLVVTKKQPYEKLREALDLGLTDWGNNYVQEGETLRKKITEEVKEASQIQWHFIGHIQSRKAKDLLTYDLVQTLDRLSVVEKLNALLQKESKKISVLVEVNIGNEPQKSGVLPHELETFLSQLKAYPLIEVKGLMAMPPPLENIEERRPYFKKMKALYVRYQSEFPFQVLSMGTSEDYLIAVEEGATLVRLGTALLGKRPL